LKDPTKGRDYLSDANYYRLGYQLAAQLLNRRLARRDEAPPDDTARDPQGSDLPDPLDVARRVLADTRLMLAWFCDRSSRTKWRRWNRIEPHEERLITFLAETVEPCTHLAAATALHERRETGDLEMAQQHVDAVMERARDNKLSYRVYYSLACWQARLADPSDAEGRLELALEYLDKSLSMAPRARAIALAEWAEKDPSLTGLRGGRLQPEFNELIGRFPRPKEPPRQADGPKGQGAADAAAAPPDVPT
jgi:hypothetical protein